MSLRISRAPLYVSTLLSLFACSGRIQIGDRSEPVSSRPSPSAFGSMPAGELPSKVESEWAWLNPKHAAANLRAIGGTSDRDLWVVGDFGTVLHWDGATLESKFDGTPEDSFWTVWANAADDVWMAGAGAGGVGAHVLHWDGAAMRDDYSLSQYTVHSLWGASRSLVWAAVDDRTLLRWDGVRWTEVPIQHGGTATGEPVRDIHGVDALHAWAVGARGRILTLEPSASGAQWVSSAHSSTKSYWSGEGDDPFDPGNDYFAVFARRTDEVWAAFQRKSAANELVTRFSRFDGTSWTVLPEARTAFFVGSHALARTPLRRGRSFAETPSGRLAFSTLESGMVVRHDDGWRLTADERASIPVWRAAVPRQLGVFRPAGGALHASSAFGGFAQLVEKGDATWFHSLASGGRDNLLEIAPVGDTAWAASEVGALLRWDGSSWQDEHIGGESVFSVFALSENAAWAASVEGRPGGVDPNFTQGAVATWNGQTWSTQSLPALRYATGVWASAPNDVWVVGDGAPFNWTIGSVVTMHFDGTSWSNVPVPPEVISVYPDKSGGEGARIFGTRTDDVWLTVTGAGNDARLLHWNGKSWRVVDRGGFTWPRESESGRAWNSGGSTGNGLDLWLPSRPALRFDGAIWSELDVPTDFAARSIVGTAPNRVFLGGAGRMGGAIRSWNGATMQTMLETSAKILDLRTSPTGDVWAVGEGGATMRLKPATQPTAKK